MRAIVYFAIVWIVLQSTDCVAQGYIRSDYLFSSTFKDENGNKLGSGDLSKMSGRYTHTFSAKQNDWKQITAWSATLSGTYGILNNRNMLNGMNPDEILNINLSVAHIRPLSKKWSLITSLGVGVYSEPNHITAKSILANGGAIFIYKVNDKLDVGLGVGLTNSYGVPIIMPMSYLKFNLTGKYELKIDLSTKIEVSATAKYSDRFKLKLVAIEMDGISAVMKRDGKSMIYSSTMMRSYLAPEFKITKSSTIFFGVGGAWSRSAQLSERTLKSFWNNFKDDDNEKYRFKPTGYLTIGFRYGF